MNLTHKEATELLYKGELLAEHRRGYLSAIYYMAWNENGMRVGKLYTNIPDYNSLIQHIDPETFELDTDNTYMPASIEQYNRYADMSRHRQITFERQQFEKYYVKPTKEAVKMDTQELFKYAKLPDGYAMKLEPKEKGGDKLDALPLSQTLRNGEYWDEAYKRLNEGEILGLASILGVTAALAIRTLEETYMIAYVYDEKPPVFLSTFPTHAFHGWHVLHTNDVCSQLDSDATAKLIDLNEKYKEKGAEKLDALPILKPLRNGEYWSEAYKRLNEGEILALESEDGTIIMHMVKATVDRYMVAYVFEEKAPTLVSGFSPLSVEGWHSINEELVRDMISYEDANMLLHTRSKYMESRRLVTEPVKEPETTPQRTSYLKIGHRTWELNLEYTAFGVPRYHSEQKAMLDIIQEILQGTDCLCDAAVNEIIVELRLRDWTSQIMEGLIEDGDLDLWEGELNAKDSAIFRERIREVLKS